MPAGVLVVQVVATEGGSEHVALELQWGRNGLCNVPPVACMFRPTRTGSPKNILYLTRSLTKPD